MQNYCYKMSRDTLVNPLPLLLFGDTFANPPLECHVWIASKTKRAQAHVQWLNQAPVSGVRHTSFSRSKQASEISAETNDSSKTFVPTYD